MGLPSQRAGRAAVAALPPHKQTLHFIERSTFCYIRAPRRFVLGARIPELHFPWTQRDGFNHCTHLVDRRIHCIRATIWSVLLSSGSTFSWAWSSSNPTHFLLSRAPPLLRRRSPHFVTARALKLYVSRVPKVFCWPKLLGLRRPLFCCRSSCPRQRRETTYTGGPPDTVSFPPISINWALQGKTSAFSIQISTKPFRSSPP